MTKENYQNRTWLEKPTFTSFNSLKTAKLRKSFYFSLKITKKLNGLTIHNCLTV